MRINTGESVDDTVGVVQLMGDINPNGESELRKLITQMLIEHNYRVLLDMSQVTHLKSGGISALIAGLKMSHEHDGDLALCCLSERVTMVMRLTGFDQLFSIYPDQQTALAAFDSRRK